MSAECPGAGALLEKMACNDPSSLGCGPIRENWKTCPSEIGGALEIAASSSWASVTSGGTGAASPFCSAAVEVCGTCGPTPFPGQAEPLPLLCKAAAAATASPFPGKAAAGVCASASSWWAATCRNRQSQWFTIVEKYGLKNRILKIICSYCTRFAIVHPTLKTSMMWSLHICCQHFQPILLADGYESKPWHPRYPKMAGSGWLFPNMIDMIVGFDPSRQIMSHKPLVIKRPSLNLAPCWEKSSRTIRDGHQYIIIS